VKCPKPDKVMRATKEYQKQNDYLAAFIDERIVEDDKASLTLQKLYIGYKEWLKESVPNSYMVEPKFTFRRLIAKRFKESSDTTLFMGRRFRDARDDKKESGSGSGSGYSDDEEPKTSVFGE